MARSRRSRFRGCLASQTVSPQWQLPWRACSLVQQLFNYCKTWADQEPRERAGVPDGLAVASLPEANPPYFFDRWFHALPAREHFACSPRARRWRAFVSEAVRGFDVDLDTVKLLVSELASNAVGHAQTSFDVSVHETSSGIRVEVLDESVAVPTPGASADDGGFGLLIVDTFMKRWGAETTEHSKVVWFEVPARSTAAHEIEDDQPSVAASAISERPTYSIGAVSQLLDVRTSTLRAWEQRYGVVVPFRSRGGHGSSHATRSTSFGSSSPRWRPGYPPHAHRLLRQRIEEVTFIPATSGTSMLVLVAERDHYAADLSEYFLRTEGYDVRIALDGQEAQRLQNSAGQTWSSRAAPAGRLRHRVVRAVRRRCGSGSRGLVACHAGCSRPGRRQRASSSRSIPFSSCRRCGT